MKTSAEFLVDHDTRTVQISARREFDVEPVTITVPFSVFKGIAAQILAVESETEKRMAENGRPKLVTPG